MTMREILDNLKKHGGEYWAVELANEMTAKDKIDLREALESHVVDKSK